MTKKTVWHEGPPPSIGWWPASLVRNKKCLRWWNGFAWSYAVYKADDPIVVARTAGRRAPTAVQGCIEWTHRPANWPERGRT